MSQDSKNFALIGAAGYIAPRHMKAIKETGNNLVAALDSNDTVGILDSYFPEARFFTEFERFDRYVDLMRRKGDRIDYVSIASPNYLHDSHIRFALRVGAHAICEKPLVVNPWNAEGLRTVEAESGRRVFTILQLRLHPSIIALRDKVAAARAADPRARFDVDLTYITSRGAWYFASWKGEEKKSGGIAPNIGIHFFDMLTWVFGKAEESELTFLRHDAGCGVLRFADTNVRWFLSVNSAHLPEQAAAKGQRTFRSITLDGEEIEFSEGFTDLHTESYRRILAGEGFGIVDALPSIELAHAIRSASPVGVNPGSHPFAAGAA
ncbi:MAG TPA: Gfo/Idh/MocA family oxidoreductase [Allosphingosinicella sp.]|nr:Gfo/Idh/MocA family oxidoreductase [Allosphingosinicella sp.]